MENLLLELQVKLGKAKKKSLAPFEKIANAEESQTNYYKKRFTVKF